MFLDGCSQSKSNIARTLAMGHSARKAQRQAQKAQHQAIQAQAALWVQQAQQNPQQIHQILGQIHQTIALGAAAAGVPQHVAQTVVTNFTTIPEPADDPPPQPDRPQMPLSAVILEPDPEGLEDPDRVR